MTKPTQKLGEYAKQVVRYAWGRREANVTAKLTWCTSKVKVPLTPGEFESCCCKLRPRCFFSLEFMQTKPTVFVGDINGA